MDSICEHKSTIHAADSQLDLGLDFDWAIPTHSIQLFYCSFSGMFVVSGYSSLKSIATSNRFPSMTALYLAPFINPRKAIPTASRCHQPAILRWRWCVQR
ncbi:hypothetical protein ATANTOWER_019990 [Ataeniobius toweri]|uniref:Uncharacterized protein n=1 Tax=Ataeniobius toweri TaxID=208326 RepID=A0ABU7A1I1_9TELE|nr:hypothetical protein [Ataeniobius toweri]